MFPPSRDNVMPASQQVSACCRRPAETDLHLRSIVFVSLSCFWRPIEPESSSFAAKCQSLERPVNFRRLRRVPTCKFCCCCAPAVDRQAGRQATMQQVLLALIRWSRVWHTVDLAGRRLHQPGRHTTLVSDRYSGQWDGLPNPSGN